MVNVDVLKAKYALRTVSFTTSEGWDLKVWDAITVSNTELNISGKFKVLSKDVATDQENVGYVTITAVEAPDAMYDGVDPGIWSPGGSIQFPELSVKAPRIYRQYAKVTPQTALLSISHGMRHKIRGYGAITSTIS